MLTAPELVKLIKAHNILSKITIPKKSRDNVNELVKLIESKNYSVDHKKKSIKPKVQRGKQITLKQAEELTKPKVDPAVAKQRREAKKKEKEEEKKKEIKIAKKEAVKEFKQKKQEAQKKKPKPAPAPKKSKPAPKKPMKKEDEVRPKEKVGRPKVDPKKIKVVQPKKKEEPKPVKKVQRRQLQETKKTTATKTEDKPQNLKLKKKLSEEEKKKKEQEIKDRRKYNQYKQDLKNFSVAELREIVKQYNSHPERKRELRIKGESKEALIGKVAGYRMNELFEINIPEKKQRAKKDLTEEEKKQKEEDKEKKKKERQEKAKQERAKEKPFIPLRRAVGQLYAKYNKQLRDNNYQGIKDIVKSMRKEFSDIMDKIEEEADEKDIELDNDTYDDIDEDFEKQISQLKSIAERGLRGEFSKEFIEKQKEEARKKREGR
jgi:hypothetical protein